MIRLEKVNKYFNKRKRNEIHVINDTTLTLAEKGLVALLGPSGCGKTTLLNAIGGLDRINKGQIFINNDRITGRTASKIDKIRNANIGYIFQNYNLIDTMSVFDNVAIVLKMIGIKDKEEIKQKVEYALDLVDMFRYRNRFANMLSGGERQRVAIARAIVKNPSIIIADEPTGNLDSKNTLEVMNIIKIISQEKLVILVTHEEKLAKFFADRIIKLKDGSIATDEDNHQKEDLDYRLDNRIYLKDIKNEKPIDAGSYKINLYGESPEKIDLQIIAKNDNIYLVCTNPNKHIEIVDEHSPIEVIDDHYREMTREEYEKHRFDSTKLSNKTNGRHASITGLGQSILDGLTTIRDYHILRKLLLFGFFISAVFIAYATSNIFGITNIEDSKFVGDNQDYLRIRTKTVAVQDYLAYEKEKSIVYLLPGNGKASFALSHNDYWQTSRFSSTIAGSLSDYTTLKKEDLVVGRLPENPYEIVIDRLILDQMLNSGGAIKQAGIGEPQELIGQVLKVNYMPNFTIVGVADLQSPSIYTDRSLFINLLANKKEGEEGYGIMEDEVLTETDGDQSSALVDVSLMTQNITLKKGRLPNAAYEVIVNEIYAGEMPLKKEIATKVNGKKLLVVGYYSTKEATDYKLVTEETIKYNLIAKSSNITVMPTDKMETMGVFEEKGLNIIDIYKYDRDKYKDSIWSRIKSSVIMAGIIILISLVEIFLIIRASFLSRIKEIGTLRAIGVKKSDIYKIFMGEIIAITLTASLSGYIFMSYIVSRLANIKYLEDMFLMTPRVFVTGLVVIFIFNIVIGLLPVFSTMRKTPAAILARTDVN
jgi:putative ABC transport system permease protein